MTYGKEAPGSSRTGLLQFGEGLPPRNPVWTSLIYVGSSQVAMLLLPKLRRNARVLKGNINEINSLVGGQEIVAHPSQDGAV